VSTSRKGGFTVIISYNQIGAARKVFAKTIAELLNTGLKYLGAPTMAYQIGEYIVTLGGDLEYPDSMDGTELVKSLEERGYCAVRAWNEDGVEVIPQTPKAAQSANFGLTVEMPKESVNIENLNNLLTAKGELIKKALELDTMQIEHTESTIEFPWFDRQLSPDECRAYTHFIAELCRLSVNSKRISPKPKPIVNEKYEFRCFLLRLGFIGKEYKDERKVLLKNLEGSAIFKTPKQPS